MNLCYNNYGKKLAKWGDLLKRSSFSIVLFLIITIIVSTLPVWAAPDINGEAYILIDGKNGQVLQGKEIDKQLNPASTTKILTAIIALEQGNLEDEVTIGKNVPLVQGTKVYLREGEKVSLGELINVTLIHSANDAALAIAEHISGSQEKFATLMNDKAQEIGAKNSKFLNPHGLTEEGHITTAYDLAMIGKHAMENQDFRDIVKKKVYDWEGQEWQNRLINKNELLWDMENSTGIKTGYTSAARHTIVASAQENERELIAVVLGCPNGNSLWGDAQKLLEYGLENFQNHTMSQTAQIVATLKLGRNQQVDLVPIRSSSINIASNQQLNLEKSVQLEEIKLPIKEGDILGQLILKIDGEEVERIPVQALAEAKKPINWLRVIINLFASLFLVQILAKTSRKIFKKAKRRKTFSSKSNLRTYRY